MHYYCKLPDVAKQTKATVAKKVESARQDAIRMGFEPSDFTGWIETNKERARVWNELPSGEKTSWDQAAATSAVGNQLSRWVHVIVGSRLLIMCSSVQIETFLICLHQMLAYGDYELHIASNVYCGFMLEEIVNAVS